MKDISLPSHIIDLKFCKFAFCLKKLICVMRFIQQANTLCICIKRKRKKLRKTCILLCILTWVRLRRKETDRLSFMFKRRWCKLKLSTSVYWSLSEDSFDFCWNSSNRLGYLSLKDNTSFFICIFFCLCWSTSFLDR